MTDVEQAEAGTAEGQGPVEIDAELDRHLGNKREELFEKFEIPDAFPDGVLEEAETRTEDVDSEIAGEVDERADLRDLTTWTTDPIDAQDFDDAISVEERDDELVLWVHIADVTHYVTPDTAMWDSAVERANTVYLPGYTVHMLPPVLAETVCSIVPEEDRLAHTVEMHLETDSLGFETIDIYKSVVRSDARLTYGEAETILDEPEAAVDALEDPGVDLAERCALVWQLADRMHEQRKEDGSLVLNPRRDRAHTIIEECMLKAKYMNDPFGGHHALNFEIYGHFTSPIRRLSDLINHWIVHTNDVPEDLVALCDRASERQQAAEQCEREYEGFLEEVGLDPSAVTNRGIAVVEE